MVGSKETELCGTQEEIDQRGPARMPTDTDNLNWQTIMPRSLHRWGCHCELSYLVRLCFAIGNGATAMVASARWFAQDSRSSEFEYTTT